MDKGEGAIEVALFPDPVAWAPDAELDERAAGPDRQAIVSSQTQRWYPREDLNLQPPD